MKRPLKWGLGIVAFLLILLITGPYLFKDRIVSKVKQSLNENLQASTDFTDISLSLFKNFPNLNVTIYNLTVDGLGDFEKIPLLHTEELSLGVQFWSLFGQRKPIEILSIYGKSPFINILVLPDGRANYDISKQNGVAPDAEESSSVTLQIDQYSITDGTLIYHDQSMPMRLQLTRFDHMGSGDFASMQFDLKTMTQVDYLSFTYDGITYLDSVRASLDAVLQIDLNKDEYTLKDNELLLNELQLRGEGFIDLNDEDIVIDLSLKAPESEFRQLASVLPGAYNQTFTDAQIKGSFNLATHIWGQYKEENYPAFQLETLITDGAIQYPDLPMAVSNIHLDLSVEKPQGIMDLLKINATKAQFQIGPQPLTGQISIRTPISDPEVEGSIQGTLDLANLAKAYPVAGMDDLAGRLKSDIQFKASMSQVENKDYEKINIKGALEVENLVYQIVGKPGIKIASSNLKFTPQSVNLSSTSVQAGHSDITLEGNLENILAFITPNKTVKGNLRLKSRHLDIDEWYTETSPPDTIRESAVASGTPAITPAFDFDLETEVGELIFNKEKIDDLTISGRIQPNQLSIRKLAGKVGESDINLRGDLTNLTSYLSGEGKLTGNIQLLSKKLDLNPFMSQPASAESEDTVSLAPLVIPDNLDLTIDAQIGELIYTDLIFANLSGGIGVRDQTASLENCAAEAFGGKIALTGGYQTLPGEQPQFDLKYDMVGVQFSKVADKISYVSILAPIIKFLDGRFSTSFITNGALQDDFMPDLSTLNLDGLVETSECLLKSFGPAEELAQRLKMNFLKSPKIKNSKNWIEVKNGIVEIKEFDYVVEDVSMQISGSQALNKDLNYLIKMKIPRKYLDANEITKEFNSQFSWLTSEATKLGFKLSSGNYVNVNVIMTGTITKPTFDLKLVGMDGEKPLVDVVKDEVKAGVEHIVDSAKTVAEAKRDSVLKQGEEKVDRVIDTLTQEAQKALDTLANKATEEIKKKVDEELSNRASEVIDDKIGEIGGEKAKEQVDKIAEKLKGWKPFGKKNEEAKDSSNVKIDSLKKEN
jgi:hypothetical protein